MNKTEDAPKPDVETLLKQAVIESPALRRLAEVVRFGEVLLQFQNEQLTTGYVKQTVRFTS